MQQNIIKTIKIPFKYTNYAQKILKTTYFLHFQELINTKYAKLGLQIKLTK